MNGKVRLSLTKQREIESMTNTTILSLLGVAGGVSHQLNTVGVKLPSTRQEWGSFIFSVIVAVIGILAQGGKSSKEVRRERNGS